MAEASARLDIGKVISRTFNAIGANLVPFAILAALLSGLPAILINIVTVSYIGSGAATDYSAVMTASLIGMVIAIVPAFVLIGALTHGSIVTFNGGKAGLGECLATGLRNALPLIAVGLMSIIAIVLGLVLLIVPGLILAVLWSVTAPAIVAEKAGILGSFGRSAELTKGNRWMIFFLYLIYFILSLIIQAAITFPFGGLMAASAVSFGGGSLIAYGVMMVYSVINGVIAAAGVAALYYELRTGKEGSSSSDLAKIFE